MISVMQRSNATQGSTKHKANSLFTLPFSFFTLPFRPVERGLLLANLKHAVKVAREFLFPFFVVFATERNPFCRFETQALLEEATLKRCVYYDAASTRTVVRSVVAILLNGLLYTHKRFLFLFAATQVGDKNERVDERALCRF